VKLRSRTLVCAAIVVSTAFMGIGPALAVSDPEPSVTLNTAEVVPSTPVLSDAATTAPSQGATDESPAPTETTVPAPSNAVPAVPSSPASTEESTDANPSLPGRTVPDPTATKKASDEVEKKIEVGGAYMGQGLERLMEHGDPQKPTDEQVAAVEQSVPLIKSETSSLSSGSTGDTAPMMLSPMAVSPTQVSPAAAVMAPMARTWKPSGGVQGLDVSGWQADTSTHTISQVNWSNQWNMGARFVYIKATEGTGFKDGSFSSHYLGATNAGMLRGGYHFAIPNLSSGAAQANFFVDNGGGWSADGMTLPPLLDIEYNPYSQYGNSCYNMSASQMVNWIRDFSNTIQVRTGRVPMIYTTTDWWNRCTGNSTAFGNNPLHIAAYPVDGYQDSVWANLIMPSGWNSYSVWQYSSEGPFAGDSNWWNGSYDQLQQFALAGRPPVAGDFEAAIEAHPELGSPTSTLVCGLRDGGCYQNLKNGALIWSSTTGLRISKNGPIRDAWQESRFENGVLGYPRSDQICGLRYGGCYQAFQNGEILWSPATGARISQQGPIRQVFRESGAENGLLGFPTTHQVCGLRDNGCYQDFQNGAIIWSSSSGARISIEGPIRERWQESRFENGILGFPTSSEICGLRDNGCYQNFQGGALLTAPSIGTQLSLNGPIRNAWQSTGFENGPLGYPTGPSVCDSSGTCNQTFQFGQVDAAANGSVTVHLRP